MSATATATATETFILSETYTSRGCHTPVLRATAKAGGKIIQCHAKYQDFRRKLLPRFTLSDSLYQFDHNVEPKATAEALSLLDLPLEILCMVFESVNDSVSQVALALSCKQMAVLAKNLNLNLSTTSPKYAGFLPREVFDVPPLMKAVAEWMPGELRLCDHCLTLRPTDREYWADVDGCEDANYWLAKTGWHFAKGGWNKQVHNICPSCHTTCSLSDFVDCDGCRALGRLGDVDWSRVTNNWRRYQGDRTPAERHAAAMAGAWDLNA